MNRAAAKMSLARRAVRSRLLRRLLRARLRLATPRLRRAGPVTVVLSMGGGGHSYSAARAARALGRRVLLVTDDPQVHEMLHSHGLMAIDPLAEPQAVLERLRAEGWQAEAVVVSIKHLLLPAQALIAEALGLPTVGAHSAMLNNDKLAWREALAEAGVPQPAYSADPDGLSDRLHVRKPASGTGSAHVALVRPGEAPPPAPEGTVLFAEEAIGVGGDQFDYEGVVEDGAPRVLSKVLERYVPHEGTIVPRFFRFDPPLDPEADRALSDCAARTLAASGVTVGAFHVEMRLRGPGLAVPIDFANRMGYERFVTHASGEDFGQAHVSCFLPGRPAPARRAPRALLQFFCWNEEDLRTASRLRAAHPGRVFDALMRPHRFANRTCLGMVAFDAADQGELMRLFGDLSIEPRPAA